MKFTSALAIYILFWAMTFFFVLPFRPGIRTDGGEQVPGQQNGAPASVALGRLALWTTIAATLAFALYYANYVYGWVSIGLFDITRGRLLG